MRSYLLTTILAACALGAPAALAQDHPPPAPPPARPYTPPPPVVLPKMPYLFHTMDLEHPAMGPRVLPWREDVPVLPGYHEGTQIRMGLLIAGAAVFGTAWIPTVVVGSVTFDQVNATWPVFLPGFGPFIAAGQAAHGDGGASIAAFLVFDGIQQSLGLAMVIAAVVPHKVLLRDDVKEAKPWWVPLPVRIGQGGVGLGLAAAL